MVDLQASVQMTSTTQSVASPASKPARRSKAGFRFLDEYDFYTEALPITLVGILLNVAGRQIASFFGIEGIFLDMIGTAFTAILLGPWWAAATAAATTLANGSFFETYFPFGVVNIIGGLVWGYLARAGDVRSKVFAAQSGALWTGLAWTVILSVAGGLAAGLASSMVKLIIYPAVGRPFVFGNLYLQIQAALEQWIAPGVSSSLTLVIGDLLRDLKDKAIVVPIAILLFAFSRAGSAFDYGTKATTVAMRLRTDVWSILVFCCAYLVFLVLAELLQPTITYPGAQRSIAWLQHPTTLLLMCLPFLAAVPALLFATFRASDRFAQRVHVLMETRRYVLRNLFRANDSFRSLISSQGVKPLGLGVSLWSARNAFETRYVSYLALIAIGIALVIYFVVSRRAFTLLTRTRNQFATLHNWLEVGPQHGTGRAIIMLMRDLFSRYLSRPSAHLSTRGELLYALDFASNRPRGGIEDLLTGQREDLFFERAAIVGVVKESKALTRDIVERLDGLTADCGANLAVVLSSTPQLLDEQTIDRVRQIRSRGTEVLLFDWTDLSLGIAEHALGKEPRQAVHRAKTRLLQVLNRTDPLDEEFSSRPAALAHRSLPSLKFIIDLLPKHRRVFDLGCGHGRHTFAALAADHSVVAADRKASVCEVLRRDLETLGEQGKPATVIEGDYLNVTVAAYGAADLVIVTGVLQHSRSLDDLLQRLRHFAALASRPTSSIYIEMLFDMVFDGMPPQDGRIVIAPDDFVRALRQVFPREWWRLEQTLGPIRQKQVFDHGGRSFDPPARIIESTAIEYVVRRAY
jgi:SAM-dependent methyltransferase